MIELTIAKNAREWRAACIDRDNGTCQAQEHTSSCGNNVLERIQIHHQVYKSHLSPRALWIVENGITLSSSCHARAHLTHNGNIASSRLRQAVDAVNCIESIKVPYFTKGKK